MIVDSLTAKRGNVPGGARVPIGRTTDSLASSAAPPTRPMTPPMPRPGIAERWAVWGRGDGLREGRGPFEIASERGLDAWVSGILAFRFSGAVESAFPKADL